MLSNLLIYRFMLVNVCFGAGATYAIAAGWAGQLYAGDTTHITWGITALFAVAWLWTTREIFAASLMLNHARDDGRSAATAAMRDKDMAKIEWLGQVCEWLVGLGLLGTVIGFGIALSGIDQQSLSSASGVSASVEVLMRGMRVALNTTIAGAVFGMWTEVNVRMLKTALTVYWADGIHRAASGPSVVAQSAVFEPSVVPPSSVPGGQVAAE